MTFTKLKVRLEKLIEDSEAEVASREVTFENRSEKWQESDKGQAYQEDTEALREGITLLEEAVTYYEADHANL